MEAVTRLEEELRAEGVLTHFGGVIPVFDDFNHTSEKDLQRAEAVACPVVALLLIVIFGSPVAALVPLLLGALAILLTLTSLRLIAGATDLSVFALNVTTLLGLGLAIDYSLFILSRYKEEFSARGPEGALVVALGTAGRAVMFSGVILASSLVGLFLFPQLFLRSMAIGGLLVTLIAVVISLTLLPALIAVLGRHLYRWSLPWTRPKPEDETRAGGFWHTVALAVMRRPLIVGPAIVALLLLLGSPFLHFHPANQDARALRASVESRQVSDILDRDFLPHETTPHLVSLQADGPVLTPERIGALFDYVERVKALPGVTRVDSLFSVLPGQSREQYAALFSRPAAQQNPLVAAGIALFAKEADTRLSVINADNVETPAAQRQVEELRALVPPAGWRVLVGGGAASLHDNRASIAARVPYMLALIGSVTFVVLFLVFGSVTLPFKAMVMNLLSLTASFGAIVWIFQDGRFEGLLGYQSLDTLDVNLPILLFGIVFGLSMDYEVLLLTRVREEYIHTGDNTLAVARGLEKTGRLITSAAALLVVVFLAFTTSTLTVLKSLGLGLALAVALDATIVRALLVPATMRTMGRWNWWAPAPLVKVWERFGISEGEGRRVPVGAAMAARPASGPEPARGTSTSVVMSWPELSGETAAPAAQVDGAYAALPAAAPVPVIGVSDFPMPSPDGPARLVARHGGAVPLDRDVTDIGSAASNAAVLDAPGVAPFHARVTLGADGHHRLIDRTHAGLTRVNGRPIVGVYELSSGDVIGIGETELAFQAGVALAVPVMEATPAPPAARVPDSSAPPAAQTGPLPVPPSTPEPGPAPSAPATVRLDRTPAPAATSANDFVLVPVPPEWEQERVPRTVQLVPAGGPAYLVATSGEEAGRDFRLGYGVTSLGRDPRNHVVLTDPAVSAFHARVECGLDGGLLIEDRASRNGLFVNGQQIAGSARLTEGEVVRCGTTSLQVVLRR